MGWRRPAALPHGRRRVHNTCELITQSHNNLRRHVVQSRCHMESGPCRTHCFFHMKSKQHVTTKKCISCCPACAGVFICKNNMLCTLHLLPGSVIEQNGAFISHCFNRLLVCYARCLFPVAVWSDKAAPVPSLYNVLRYCISQPFCVLGPRFESAAPRVLLFPPRLLASAFCAPRPLLSLPLLSVCLCFGTPLARFVAP